jgi:hypothetical protein
MSFHCRSGHPEALNRAARRTSAAGPTAENPVSWAEEDAWMSFRQLGGCECGRIRFQLTSDPITVYACHCTDCQTATGSSFALSMYVTREALELLRGEPQLREFYLPDGRERRVFACAECGTSLWGARPGLPDLLNLQPGTLDDTSWFRPIAHIWTRSAQPWVQIPADALRYEEQPEDPLPLVRAWKSFSGSS